MSERYGKQIPLLLRMMMCWGIQDRSYRFKWGEFAPRWGFTLKYGVYHEEGTIVIHLLCGAFYLKAPMLITQRDGTEDWNAAYGVCYFERGLQCYWRDKCKIIHMPWDWSHVRHTFLNADGSVHHHAGRWEYGGPEETKAKYAYRYVLRNGTVQDRIATVNGDEREWRWRWFQWSPWPRRISRSIDVSFNDEVGERTGSWKGGTIGCGYDWRKGETQEQALRRMERERKF